MHYKSAHQHLFIENYKLSDAMAEGTCSLFSYGKLSMNYAAVWAEGMHAEHVTY